MKAIAFFMLILMLFVSTTPGKAGQAMGMKNCCHRMTHISLQHHGAQKGCDGGMCVTMLSCNNCCFLKTEPVEIGVPVVVTNVKTALPYLTYNLSGYANTCWNPPKA